MFKPSTGPLTFDASLDITFNVTAPTSCVVLNARDLNFTSVAVGGAAVCSSAAACISDGDAVSAPFARFQAVQGSSGAQLVSTGDEDLVAIDLGAAQLTPQSGTLSLRYTGLLGRIVGGGETGLLRSRSFVPLGGNASEVLVATQGAQNGGRKILPCYDQPRFKAVFEVAVQASGDAAGLAALLARRFDSARSVGPLSPRCPGSTPDAGRDWVPCAPLKAPWLLLCSAGPPPPPSPPPGGPLVAAQTLALCWSRSWPRTAPPPCRRCPTA